MKKWRKKGFTIVELVIVIAVIGILSAVLIPTFSNVIEKAEVAAALQTAKNAYTEYASGEYVNGKTVYEVVIVKVSDKQFVNVINGNVKETVHTSEELAKKAITEPCKFVVLALSNNNEWESGTEGAVTTAAPTGQS